MRVLLDTHVLVWWWEDSSRLSKQASSILVDRRNEVLLSAATAWELAIKVNLGKIKNPEIITEMETQIAQGDLIELPISASHAIRAGLSPRHHRDPFDRLLVAQAQELGIPILSADRVLDRYGVRRLW